MLLWKKKSCAFFVLSFGTYAITASSVLLPACNDCRPRCILKSPYQALFVSHQIYQLKATGQPWDSLSDPCTWNPNRKHKCWCQSKEGQHWIPVWRMPTRGQTTHETWGNPLNINHKRKQIHRLHRNMGHPFHQSRVTGRQHPQTIRSLWPVHQYQCWTIVWRHHLV